MTDSRPERLDVSVVIPVYDEEGNVRLLHERTRPVLDGLGLSWEILFVDDGSRDGTFDRLREIRERDRRVRVVRLRRNFGQTAALAAGFQHARGDRVVTMDGDLQNDPRDIPAILAKMDEGFQVVSGWRKSRKEPFLTRRLPSITANALISRLSGVPLHDYGCTLKGYEREVAQRLHIYAEMHRFLPALASLTGARAAEVPVRDHPRHSGVSKYGLGRVGRVMADLVALQMILHFASRPRYWFSYLAFPFALAGTVIGLWAAYWYINQPAGQPPIVLPGTTFLLFFAWFYLLSLGWFAEIVTATGNYRQGSMLSGLIGRGEA
ncbi:MAG: glycosyltransferase family 2 protein [Candidatus Eisenbacteria bacterium]|nr:glycosyltransferase family 2 protein [Candidatus Eisenbacteria bacterium]